MLLDMEVHLISLVVDKLKILSKHLLKNGFGIVDFNARG